MDSANGSLTPIRTRLRAEIFGDYLARAESLLADGFKDSAAVLIGATLEEHLRQLCITRGVPVEDPTTARPRPAEALNQDLAHAKAYDPAQQDDVTTWLDLRNKAAHGRYNEYEPEKVDLMLQSVRLFIRQYPA